MRVAIVHDYLTQFGGAERVLLSLMELFPNAPVFTLLHDRKQVPLTNDVDRIKTSFLQKIPGAKKHHRFFPLLMPLAVEQFNFNEYDIVFSDTHSFSKGVVTGPTTMHISYCFTPTRYVWDDCHRYLREFSHVIGPKKLAPLGLSYIRLWDYYAAQRVDHYLTLSKFVARRIKKYYRREASVIAPPVDLEAFSVSQKNDGYYLVVARLVPYKRIDIAIEACERLGRSLKIVGIGPEIESLKKRGRTQTQFLGFVPDLKLSSLYQNARALLFPQEEDFGITPLEAAASGKPTIAFASGGALETILPDETGIFFEDQTANSLSQAIIEFEKRDFDSKYIRQHAEQYHKGRFLQEIQEAVQTHWMAYQQTNQTRICR